MLLFYLEHEHNFVIIVRKLITFKYVMSYNTKLDKNYFIRFIQIQVELVT